MVKDPNCKKSTSLVVVRFNKNGTDTVVFIPIAKLCDCSLCRTA